jgi:hypothetical protein
MKNEKSNGLLIPVAIGSCREKKMVKQDIPKMALMQSLFNWGSPYRGTT